MNNKFNDWTKSKEVWDHLQGTFELRLGTFHVEPLDLYQDLIRTWNPLLHLLSAADAESAIDDHVADSWSLAPYCARSGEATLLDVGSGGGFPGIPLALVLPDLKITLLERSEKKSAFLMRAVTQLSLRNVRVVTGSFPSAVCQESPFVFLTARAVEKPGSLRDEFAACTGNGTVFLCQSKDALPDAEDLEVVTVEDCFSRDGLRRGDLWLVKRRS